VQDIAGVDEAGVAPLAGPVVAAAVMFPPGTQIAGIDDSKKLDAPTRERLAGEIRAKASGVGVGIATVEDIDRINIYHASLLAMRRAVEALPRVPQNAFNKGDGINFTIAAASIIAKTQRDALMAALDRDYPGYGFAGHKGYPTPEHRDAVIRLGPSPVHRMSFPVIHELRGEFSARFYDLKRQLEAAGTHAAMKAFEEALREHAEGLEERECRKLKLIALRRWKLVAA